MDCELGSGLMIPLKESIQQFKGSRDPASVRVIFALLAFGEVFGFVGVLVALPASAVLLVAIRRVREGYLASRLYLG